MAERKQFRLPDVGEGLTEADIVSWRVKPGDRVTLNQVIVEIETAKSLVELPSPFDGVVTRLLVAEGETAAVGTPIIEIEVGAGAAQAGAGPAGEHPAGVRPEGAGGAGPAGEHPAGVRPEGAGGAGPAGEPLAGAEPAGGPAPADQPAQRQAVLVGYGVKMGQAKRRPRKQDAGPAGAAGGTAAAGDGAAAPAAGPASQAAGPASQAAGPASQAAGPAAPAAGPAAPAAGPAAGPRPAAKPPVRKLARDLGVDLAAIAGSGPAGIITREDVQAAARLAVAGTGGPGAGAVAAGTGALAPGTGAPGAAAPRVATVGEERIPVKGVRKHTAAAVTASAFTAPHVTEFLQVDMTETMRATERLAGTPEFAGLRLSPLLLVAKALLLGVARYPMINSSWDEDAQEIVVKHYVNLGIAVATERGLLVPNIKNAHTLPLPGLARALADLATIAREGRAQPADLAGGTITITNVGVFGVDCGTPILTPGEAAILALGQVREAPWVHEGALAVRQVATLGLSFDHRIVDGDLGSKFLRDVGAMLTDPVRMLAWC
jgi:2-oxoisovalerate dehydrogenase E2 component (dihydrolipoyl transacylase)